MAEQNRGQLLEGRGLRGLSLAQGLRALARLTAGSTTQIGVAPLDLRQWLEFYPTAASSRILSRLVAEERSGRRPGGDKELLVRLAAASSDERVTILEGFLRQQVSSVLRLSLDRLDSAAPLTSLGMDSLMGLEIRNRIEAGLGIRLQATLLWTYGTVLALSRYLASAGEPPLPSVAAPASETNDGAEAAVDELTADELASFIAEEFRAV